jgi:putative aldouronate transport system permease protein
MDYNIIARKRSIKEPAGSQVFSVVNIIVLTILALICILPFVNILAISLSSNAAATAGHVNLLPKDFNFQSYIYVARRSAFWRSMGVTIIRCILGVFINTVLCILTAYPLSKDNKKLGLRTVYAWFFFLTMIINSGLIPWYMTINSLHLTGTVWALVLPGALPVFNVVLMLNFFRAIPGELEEAAFIDGASHFTIMARIFVPISKASIATISLFSLVNHWNSWFDGIILMKKPSQYPLQSYLQTVIIQGDTALKSMTDWQSMALVSDRTLKCAQIFISTIPIILAYPFLQRYFVKGMVLGSVKG